MKRKPFSFSLEQARNLSTKRECTFRFSSLLTLPVLNEMLATMEASVPSASLHHLERKAGLHNQLFSALTVTVTRISVSTGQT